MGPENFSCLRTIKKVLVQQTILLDHQPRELKDRIVSLHRPYVKPIVRGKKNKPVEFGIGCPGLSGPATFDWTIG